MIIKGNKPISIFDASLNPKYGAQTAVVAIINTNTHKRECEYLIFIYIFPPHPPPSLVESLATFRRALGFRGIAVETFEPGASRNVTD